MNIPKQYRDICEMLFQATNDGRVSWIEMGGTITVRLPDFSLEIWGGTDERSIEFVAMGLRDPKSRELFDSWYVEDGETDFEMMKSLFVMARRQTGGIAKRLQKLRDLLKTSEQIGGAAPEVLVIESALYGAGGKTIEVAHILRPKIESGKIENFRVTNEAFGSDPVPNVVKTLTIKYSYMGQSRSASFPEGGKISLPEKDSP